MSMNTSVNTAPVTTIKPTAAVNGTASKVSTPDISQQVQPEAQVDIQNSLKSLLTSLEKTTAKADIPLESLPPEVQKMINSILKNAFSLDSSLGKGLSDVLQNQKLTLEQLSSLAKLLEQAAGINSGDKLVLSDGLKVLLQNMNLLDSDGKVFDNISLNKLALQLLEGKNTEELAQVLQLLLAQPTNNTLLNTPTQGSSMQFLKQLVQYFMPARQDTAANTAEQNTSATKNNNNSQLAQSNSPANNTTAANGNENKTAAQNKPATGAAGQTGTAGNPQNNQMASNTTTNNTNNAATNNNPNNALNMANKGQTAAASGSQANNTNNGGQANNTAGNSQANNIQQSGQLPNSKINMTGSKTAAANLTQNSSNPAVGSNNAAVGKFAQQQSISDSKQTLPNNQQSANSVVGKQQTLNNQQQAAGNNIIKQTFAPVQNTPNMVNILKNLAIQLQTKQNLLPEDILALQKFAGNEQVVLADKDLQEVQKLIQAATDNIPQTLQLAGAKQNIPDLPRLWAFVQLCNLTKLLELSTERLRNAGKNINDFAVMLKKAMQNENEVVGSQRSMSFMTPLYMGDPEKYYPTYIHVYDESAKNQQTGEEQKETWLRICLLTENIGAVEAVFRLYENNNINLRLAFSATEAADTFNSYLPELKEAFADLPLNLNDIKISAIGEDNG